MKTIVRQIIKAESASSVTRFDDLWAVEFACGHKDRVPKGRHKNKPPAKLGCRQCAQNARETEPVDAPAGLSLRSKS